MGEILLTKETTETLFVGVGGVGSDIVAKVAGMCKGEELNNVRFVVMDTDANWLKSIEENGAFITKVQTSTSLTVKEYLEKDDEARLKWFPNNSTLYGKTVSEGAGQVRAISRLALNNTIRTGEIQKLYKEIENLLLKDPGNFKQALRVVVVSSATGGTGSGMAMITAMLIREYLHENYPEKKAIIRGFFVLPSVMDKVINSQIERDSQYRNGYATIKEINAFMMIASGYGGTVDSLKRYRNLHVSVPTATGGNKQLSCLPFDFCFLMEAADKNAENLDSLDAYKTSAALCIYEQNISPMQAKSFALEDNIIKEFSDKNKYARNRFGGIGASRLVYPYDDIADYVAYSRALQRIGGSEGSGSWAKYDKAYDEDFAEYKKKRAESNDPEPTPESSYIRALERDNTRFGKDIKAEICGADGYEELDIIIDNKIQEYLSNLTEHVKNVYIPRNPIYDSVMDIVKKSYKYDNRNQTSGDLNDLRDFESSIKSGARKYAKNLAQTIFYSAPKIGSEDVKNYHIEYLIRTNSGAIHPSAVRYILYKLTEKITESHKQIKETLTEKLNSIKKYGEGYQAEEGSREFDVDNRFSKDEERDIESLIEVANNDRNFIDKKSGFDSIYSTIEEHIHKYGKQLNELLDATLNDAVYEVAEKYLQSLNTVFESFYRSFDAKAVDLLRRKDSIVDSLKNVKGSTVHYLCSCEEQLEEITRRVPEGRHGFLLPGDLSADIFEIVKKNADLQRIRENDDYAEGQFVDIFDETLLDYFKKQVREDGKERMDLNIVNAVFLDAELADFLERKRKDEKATYNAAFMDERRKRHELLEALRKGSKLASPSISGQNFVEPREVHLCTFSKELMDMRDIKVKDFIEGQKIQPIESETVSKYELRFFTAVYNITPDNIPLFRGPQHDKVTGGVNDYDTGIYYKAYHEYGKLIGPDSMRSSTISTHIDKRWDAIVELPELDFDVLNDEIRKAHVSLICGLLMGNIRKFPSTRYDKKRVFMIVNDEGDHIPLIVSNGTECDEFYEVLDALYRDKEHANMLIEAAEEYTKTDIEKNITYSDSAFVRFLNSFRIPDGHNNPTSLFEIPLMYYNSLPNALKDNHEISVMIDAVVYLLESVVKKLEREQDQNAYLCLLLEEQFDLLTKSFLNKEYDSKFGIRKNTEIYDNIVISMVSKKIIKKLKEVDVADCSDRVEAINKVTREPDSLYETAAEGTAAEGTAAEGTEGK